MPALKRNPQGGQGAATGAQAPAPTRSYAGSQPSRGTGGGAGVGVNLIILVLVAVSVIIAAGLLADTVNTARSIDRKAKSIRDTGIGINTATDSIAQLQRTNRLASSILRTADPLAPALTRIVRRARSINSSARSIDSLASTILSTAGTINTSATTIGGSAGDISSTAGTIGGTAGSINTVAGQIRNVAGRINRSAGSINRTVAPGAGILGIARVIDNDADDINDAAERAQRIGRGILVDSGNILNQARAALDNAACIDAKLPGPDAGNNCQGK